ncbi:MAG: glycosyltransferase [Phycisphaerales bacterium]|nr:MAG: glycosyltransferase [Phycisphaerales bacterium]
MPTRGYGEKFGPLVSVLVPTYNRPQYLQAALASVVRQDYGNLEIFVIRDGGKKVRDVVESFNDPRVIFIDRDDNRGIPFSLNEALAGARGEYVCYLGDDDLYYSSHVSTLLRVLEGPTDCQAAYSDLYRTYCTIGPGGGRLVLSKIVEVSRDFDRFLMLCFNHVLHVSLMHRRDLIEKTGPYNEELTVLIDWDLTRKLSFFTDFQHVPEITGEFYSPVGDSDRVSVRQRKDKSEYLRNVITIRTTRPPKPWSKIQDLSIILVTAGLDDQTGSTLSSIWRHTFYPYEVYLPLPGEDFRRLNADMPNIVLLPVERGSSDARRVDAALARCGGAYVAIVPSGFPIRGFWLEDSLYALINSPAGNEALELEGSTDRCRAFVLKSDDLRRARGRFANLGLRESLDAAGILTRRVLPDEIPFQFDEVLGRAKLAEEDGDWARAARLYEYAGDHYQNRIWMKSQAAKALFRAGDHRGAARLFSQLNRQRPTVETLLSEAKLSRRSEDFKSAIELLERADQVLEGKEMPWI